MPPLIGCEESNKELAEDDGVTPLAGGHVVSCLRQLDVKNLTKSPWKMMVSRHWLEDMLCHASAYWMSKVQQNVCGTRWYHTIGWRTCCAMPPPIGCEGSNKSLWKTSVSHHRPEDVLCHASAYWV